MEPRKDRLGTVLLFIPLVALALALLTTITRLIGFRMLGLLILAPACAIVCAIDAFRGRKTGGRPVLIFLGVLLVWIVFYPFWMFRRGKVVPGARSRGVLGLLLAVAVGAFSFGLVERLLGDDPVPWSTPGASDSDWDDD